ncbi:MAG TPA: hypothetical protein VF715_17945 [Thermoleophilaceae bacterium]
MLRRTALLMFAVAALMAAAAPVASADDASVLKAWTAENKTLSKLEKQLDGQIKASKANAAISTIGKIRKLVARRKKALAAEEPSTSDGKDGKSLALANLRDYDAAMVKLKRGIEAAVARKGSQAQTYFNQYRALIKKAANYEKRANQQFKEAGVL